MRNEIIKTLIGIEIQKKNNWYADFNNMYRNKYEAFSNALIELRNTNLGCVDDEMLLNSVSDCSLSLSGKDVVFLDVVLLMLYFEIDIQENINTMLSVFRFSKFETQQEVMSIIYDTYLTKIFTRSFITYQNNCLMCRILDYIDAATIDTVQVTELYYSVVKKKHPSVFKRLPKKILCVGMVSEAFGIIDGDGLDCFYRHFKKDYIESLCNFLVEIGGERFANIIIYGSNFYKDYKKLEHLEHKIYNLEKKLSIDKLLCNYLRDQSRGPTNQETRDQLGDGSMIEP